MPQAFERLVVQIDVRQLDFALRQRIGIDGEVVVVRRDLDLAGRQLLYRMIAAVVSELQLVGLAAEREPDQLMAQADAEDRLPCPSAGGCCPPRRCKARDRRGRWTGRRRRLQREHVFRRGLRRNHGDAAAFAHAACAGCSA